MARTGGRKPLARPPTWSEDKLTAFLQDAYENRFATFANKRSVFQRLIDIDACFLRAAGTDWRNSGNLVSALLFMRSHSAFRGACEHATASQIGEVYPLLRSCIEYAAYAVHIDRIPDAGEVWLRRHDDDKTLRASKDAFKVSAVRRTLQAANVHAAERFDMLYQLTIDFGAHPNERAVTGNLKIVEGAGERRFEQAYLQGDGLALDHALITAARVGLCALEILQCAFPARFEILGASAAMLELRKGL